MIFTFLSMEMFLSLIVYTIKRKQVHFLLTLSFIISLIPTRRRFTYSHSCNIELIYSLMKIKYICNIYNFLQKYCISLLKQIIDIYRI